MKTWFIIARNLINERVGDDFNMVNFVSIVNEFRCFELGRYCELRMARMICL